MSVEKCCVLTVDGWVAEFFDASMVRSTIRS